jgi:hypothetical protein
MKAFNAEALARLCACHRDEEVCDDDPDDRIDPDDLSPVLSVTAYTLPPSPQTEPPGGRGPDTSAGSNAPGSPPGAHTRLAGTPAPPDLLDPAVLRTMPPKVAAFMMFEPPDPPPWRTKPPPDGMDEGSWCG